MTAPLAATVADLRAFAAGRTFRTLYADPPWQFQNRTGKGMPYVMAILDDVVTGLLAADPAPEA